jgi:hypothetical protein
MTGTNWREKKEKKNGNEEGMYWAGRKCEKREGYVAGGEKKEEKKIIIIIRNRCTWVVEKKGKKKEKKKKKRGERNRGRE